MEKESTARAFWKVAEVIVLLKSSDGVVRSARIRVLSSDGKRVTELRRPIQHLVPLELNITSEVKNSAVADKSNEVNEESIDDQSTVNDNGTELPQLVNAKDELQR